MSQCGGVVQGGGREGDLGLGLLRPSKVLVGPRDHEMVEPGEVPTPPCCSGDQGTGGLEDWIVLSWQ